MWGDEISEDMFDRYHIVQFHSHKGHAGAFLNAYRDDMHAQQKKLFQLDMVSLRHLFERITRLYPLENIVVPVNDVMYLVNVACVNADDEYGTELFESCSQTMLQEPAFTQYSAYQSTKMRVQRPRHIMSDGVMFGAVVSESAVFAFSEDQHWFAWCNHIARSKVHGCRKRKCIHHEEITTGQDLPNDVEYGLLILFICNVAKRMLQHDSAKGFDYRIAKDYRYSIEHTIPSFAKKPPAWESLKYWLYRPEVCAIEFEDEKNDYDVRIGLIDKIEAVSSVDVDNDDDDELTLYKSEQSILAHRAIEASLKKESTHLYEIFTKNCLVVNLLKNHYDYTVKLRFGDTSSTSQAKVVWWGLFEKLEAAKKRNTESQKEHAQKQVEDIREQENKRRRLGYMRADELTVDANDRFQCAPGNRVLESEESTCNYFRSDDGAKSAKYGYNDSLAGTGECISLDDIVKYKSTCYSREALGSWLRAQRRDRLQRPYMYRPDAPTIKIPGTGDVGENELERDMDELQVQHRLSTEEVREIHEQDYDST